MLQVGDRVQNTFSGLVGKVVQAQLRPYAAVTHAQWFWVVFEDDERAARHYARNGPNGTFAFSSTKPWLKIDDAPAPMDDTRDYLNALISFRA